MKTALEEEEEKRDKALEMLNKNERELNKTHELKTTKAHKLCCFFFNFPHFFPFHSPSLDGNSHDLVTRQQSEKTPKRRCTRL